MFFSCDDNPSNVSVDDPYPAPKNIAVSVSPSQVELSWEAIQEATAYVVSYGTSAAYGFTIETREPCLSIPDLDIINGTWYFAVQAKYGDRKSLLPSNPVVLKGGVVISGTDEEDKQDPNQGVPGPFDFAKLASKKAAWKALGIKSYRFVRSEIGPDDPPIHIQSTIYHDKEPELIAGPDGPDVDSGLLRYVKTIDDLYSFIETTSTNTNHKYVIRYNKQYHYPEYYLSTPVGPEVVGGWIHFEISWFGLLDEEGKQQDPNPDDPMPWIFDSARLAAEKAAWKALGIKSYRLTSEISSDIPSVYVQSTVYPDKEAEIIVGPDEPGVDRGSSEYVRTIDDLYSFIETMSTGDFFKYVVRYNKQYHYPEYFLATMGPGFDGGMINVEITGFEPLDDE
jgi:hypothetical protein